MLHHHRCDVIVGDFVITMFYNHAALVVTPGDFSYDKLIVQRLFKRFGLVLTKLKHISFIAFCLETIDINIADHFRFVYTRSELLLPGFLVYDTNDNLQYNTIKRKHLHHQHHTQMTT